MVLAGPNSQLYHIVILLLGSIFDICAGFDNAMGAITLLYIFLSAAIIQLGFYLLVFSRLVLYRNDKKNLKEVSQPVSVIICARNEEVNLKNNLSAVLEQDYHDFEVVVVNDASEDNSAEILAKLQLKHPHLNIIEITSADKLGEGKKHALEKAIRAAKHNIVLLTDADCKPVSNNWIKMMARNFDTEEVQIVLGYSPYLHQSTFLNFLIRFDVFYTALQYFSFTLSKMPYMGVGRNLAYTKELFFKNNGFENHLEFICGDDDLFVNETANVKNTRVALSKDSFVASQPKETFKELIIQKRRHWGAGRYYRNDHLMVLGILFLSQFFFYYSFLLLLFSEINLNIILLVFGLRFLIQLIVFKKVAQKLNETTVFWLFSPLMDFLYLGFGILMNLSNLFIPKSKWQ
ncbi:MAG: hypothetical protein COC01_00935 [Bacteroidetes bacterium]|nr:glycosyltransferase [Bacteroidia bacterium]PCH69684.1 MAG: hypothetical protein COC01_00935 [Bacteroidota bacterium]